LASFNNKDNHIHNNHYNMDAERRAMSERAFDIEKKSFEIIDAEVGTQHQYYDEMQWSIVRRVIHSTADFDFANSTTDRIIFHQNAISSAFEAIRNKCTILTDVDMVRAAINKKSVTDLGLKTVCHISDREVLEEARRSGMTRSEAAMRHGAKDMDGGIVTIGNAPTALYEVIKMIKEEMITPALIIGLPVGFVSAQESKEQLTKMDNVPFITNIGRKGGSPAASSIINALLLLYQSKGSS
jgi:precorrin-8X/cobalt-precorrin-8 methylmutase